MTRKFIIAYLRRYINLKYEFQLERQVRVVFLYWLPCILRMSRPIPEEEDEDEKHQKAAKIQCVELKDRYDRIWMEHSAEI